MAGGSRENSGGRVFEDTVRNLLRMPLKPHKGDAETADENGGQDKPDRPARKSERG